MFLHSILAGGIGVGGEKSRSIIHDIKKIIDSQYVTKNCVVSSKINVLPIAAGPEEPVQCVLPNPTSLGAPSDMGEGHFFGKSPYSYFEYDQLPSGLRVKYVFTLHFIGLVVFTDFLSLLKSKIRHNLMSLCEEDFFLMVNYFVIIFKKNCIWSYWISRKNEYLLITVKEGKFFVNIMLLYKKRRM